MDELEQERALPPREDTVGVRLRRARQEKKLTYEQIEEQINVRTRYLQALEEEDYSALPGDVFVRGMLRTYGNFLGLDGLALVEMYKNKFSTQGSTATQSGAIREADKVKVNISLKQKRDWGTGNGFSWKNIELPKKQIGIGLAVVAILGGLYFAIPKAMSWWNARGTTPAATTSVAANNAKQTPEATTPATAVTRDKVTLVIEANGRCWTEVSGDGVVVYEGMLFAKDKKSFEAKDKLVVKFGNVGVISAVVDDKPVSYEGEHGVATKTYYRAGYEPEVVKPGGAPAVPQAAAPVTNKPAATVKAPAASVNPPTAKSAPAASVNTPANTKVAPADKATANTAGAKAAK